MNSPCQYQRKCIKKVWGIWLLMLWHNHYQHHQKLCGFWHILKSTLISSQLMNVTLISSQPWNQSWFQKTVLAHFEISFDFKGNFNCSQVNNFHILFTMSHSWVLKRVWTLSSWMILLSRHQHRWKGVDCLGEDFQISMLYLLAKKSWCALNCSSVKIVSL